MKANRGYFIKKGKWRTLETFFNANREAFFDAPIDAWIKVRYGVGWLGKDRQKQKLDGRSINKLKVGKASVLRARMQIKVKQDSNVDYFVKGDGVSQDFPKRRF